MRLSFRLAFFTLRLYDVSAWKLIHHGINVHIVRVAVLGVQSIREGTNDILRQLLCLGVVSALYILYVLSR